MKISYSGGRPIEVIGPVTGTKYRFSGMARIGLVDPRDAVMMVRNRSFRVEGIVELPPGEDAASGRRETHG